MSSLRLTKQERLRRCRVERGAKREIPGVELTEGRGSEE